jgi:hypothetical protein
MMRHFFDLLAQEGWMIDDEGMYLPDGSAALEHARLVAHELMRGAERSRRYWRLRIHDEDGTSFGELLFASVDPTLDHLTSELRGVIEVVSWNFGELTQRATELDAQRYVYRALLARLKRQPFLVTVGGRRVATISAEPERRRNVLPPRLVAAHGQITAGQENELPSVPAKAGSNIVDRDFALQHLATAQRHVAESEQHVRNQRKIVTQVEQRGDDPTRSRQLLALFEDLYARHVGYRDRLVKEVSEAA